MKGNGIVMARLTFNQKSHRVVTFLLGMRNPRVFGALARYGFNQEALDEGWRLLNECGKVRGLRPDTVEAVEPKIVAKIDAWENEYFPVAEATLRRNFPDVHKRVFLNLSQTSGPPVVVGVKLFVDRVLDLEKATDKQSKDARALLKDRGIDKAAIDEAKALLIEAGTPLDAPAPVLEDFALELETAQQAMWDWYLEWAQIARVAVQDGRHLIQLFGSRRVAEAPEADETEPEAADATNPGNTQPQTD